MNLMERTFHFQDPAVPHQPIGRSTNPGMVGMDPEPSLCDRTFGKVSVQGNDFGFVLDTVLCCSGAGKDAGA